MGTALKALEYPMTDATTLAKQVGKRIAVIRKGQGMTQVELAEMVELSQQVIAEYEAGRKNIPVWRLVNLAEALGVKTSDLLKPGNDIRSRRGPTPKLQRQMESISSLPKEKQKSIMQVLDMALKSA